MKMVGIVDALGIESFIPLKGHQRETFIFSLRAKANQQRNAVCFCLDFKDEEIKKINNLINDKTEKSFIEAGIIVTKKLDSLIHTFHTKTNKKLYGTYKLRGYI
jgi:hypothetical protein